MKANAVKNENRQLPSPEIVQNAWTMGAWEWIGFDVKPTSALICELKSLGFRQNHSLRVWRKPASCSKGVN